jgi:hypothetical protein
MPTLSILAGPKGLHPGTELTFFYPSTEWAMAQSFDCFCGTPSCKGRIAGASNMDSSQLDGMWLNGYIRDMLEERDLQSGNMRAYGQGTHGLANGPSIGGEGMLNGSGKHGRKGTANGSSAAHVLDGGAGRMGPTSRELSGEMGGDTSAL